MTLDEIKAAQTANPPQYDAQGMQVQPGAVPTTTAAPGSNPPAAGSPAPSTPPVGGGSSPFALSQVMTALENQYKTNNSLMTQRNLVLKHLYDQPLTPDELNQLDPTLAKVLQSGDRTQIDMNLRLISDQVAGRTQTLDQSIKYLADSYQTQVQQAEKNKQDAISNVLQFAQLYGSNAKAALTSLYGQPYLDQLKSMGINIDQFTGVPTITQSRYNMQYGAAGASPVQWAVNDPSRLVSNNNPTAFTTDVAKDMGLVQGVDYVQGTPFTDSKGNTLYTAQLLGDPISTTIKGLDQAGFYTASGKPRWSYVSKLPQNIINNWQNASVQDKTAVVQQMYQFEGGHGTLSAPQVDSAPPNPQTANIVDPSTGMTPNAIFQDSIEYMFTGKTPSLGLGSAAQTKNARFAIQNKASAIAAAAGNTFPQLQALYKANSAAATQNVERLARVESVSQAMTLNIPRLMQLADQVNSAGISITESDLQATQAQIQRKFGGTPAAAYLELIQTMRSDYAATQAALAGSRGGQFFAENASDAIPIGLSSAQYQTIGNTIIQSSQNATQAINDEVNNLIGVSGGLNVPGTTPAGGTSGNDPLGLGL